MQISKIHLNLLNSNLKSQKVLLRPAKINFRAQNQDTFTATEDFSDKDALELLREELAKCMNEEKLDSYMQKIKEICELSGIAPRDLPINKEHPGSLEGCQQQQILFLANAENKAVAEILKEKAEN